MRPERERKPTCGDVAGDGVAGMPRHAATAGVGIAAVAAAGAVVAAAGIAGSVAAAPGVAAAAGVAGATAACACRGAGASAAGVAAGGVTAAAAACSAGLTRLGVSASSAACRVLLPARCGCLFAAAAPGANILLCTLWIQSVTGAREGPLPAAAGEPH